MAQQSGTVNGTDFFSIAAARRAFSPMPPRSVRGFNAVTEDEFFAAMQKCSWAEHRREVAYRVLVQRHPHADVAADLALTKSNVAQTARVAFGLVERHRLEQMCASQYGGGGVADVAAEVVGMIARVNAYISSQEPGPELVALRKSVGFLQSAADELRPQLRGGPGA